MEKIKIDLDGHCPNCEVNVASGHSLNCADCKSFFHAACSKLEKPELPCTKTFLDLFLKAKSNFKWYCDYCDLKRDTAMKVSLTSSISELAKKVETLNDKVDELTAKTTPGTNQSPGIPSVSQGGVWSNPNAVQRLRASLVIKPNSPQDKLDMKALNKIVVENNVQVSKVGVSTKGNTFIHCTSVEARDRLEEKVKELAGQTAHSLSDKEPSISLVGLTEELSKIELKERIRDQNPDMKTLIDAGENFTILFMKPPTGDYSHYQIIARVSPKIRDAIKSNWNRLYVGMEAIKVYDRFYVKRCNKCNQFGHYVKDCTNSKVCGVCCSEEHESEGCPNKDTTDMSLVKCINCKNRNLEEKGHKASWFKCPAYIEAQKKVKGTIPYYDGSKNQKRPLL